MSHTIDINPLHLTKSDIDRFQLFDLNKEMTNKLIIPKDQIQIINEQYEKKFGHTRKYTISDFQKKKPITKFNWDPIKLTISHTYLDNDKLVTEYGTIPIPYNSKHKRILINMYYLFLQENNWNISSNIPFDNYVRRFNFIANQINQILHLEGDQKIQMAWKHQKEKNYRIKPLMEHSMLALPHEKEDLPLFAQEIKELEDKGMDLNTIRDHSDYKHLYNARSEFIRKDAIFLHRCNNKYKHIIYPYEIINHIDQWSTDLKSGRYYYDHELHGNLTFGILGKNKNIIPTINNNDVFLRCACILKKSDDSFDLERCNYHFNLKNDINYNILKDILSKVPKEYLEKASTLLDLIDELRLGDNVGKHRIYSDCIHCGHKNKNEEALLNSTGENPKLRHPSDITCQSCHKDYCADCLQEHPGIICRGFRQGEDNDTESIACPGCRVPIYKESGCAFMICAGKCKRMFCWSCRSIRHEENSYKHHYCLLINSFQVNPNWSNNPKVRTYISQSPIIR